MNLDGKTFRVVRNDGPGAEVTEETVFRFSQDGELVRAEYSGGGVRSGVLVGILRGESLTHRYVQINLRDEFQSGQSRCLLRSTDRGLLQIVDSWQWETKDGRGECVMEET